MLSFEIMILERRSEGWTEGARLPVANPLEAVLLAQQASELFGGALALSICRDGSRSSPVVVIERFGMLPTGFEEASLVRSERARQG